MPDYLLDELAVFRRQRERIDAYITEVVTLARAKGYSWERIAQALGVARQNAWERYHQQVEEAPHRDLS